MMKIINKLFLIREIKSKAGVLHFRRWRIISTKWFSIYIHGIYKADEDEHLHDHPWDYTSIILKGDFKEQTPFSPECPIITRTVCSGQIIKRKGEQLHKVRELLSPAIYTLFFTGPRKREWGYQVNGKWIDNVTYRKLKNQGLLWFFMISFSLM